MPPSVRQPTPFGTFLLRHIAAAGFDSVTKFAKAAGVSPATVGRLIYGSETAPDVRTLEAVAVALNIPVRDVLLAQIAERPSEYVTESLPETHAVARELALMLAKDSPLSEDDRAYLTLMTDRLIGPYRAAMRRP